MQYINYAKLLSRLFWIRVLQTDLSGNEILKKKALFLSECYSTALKVWNLLKHIWHLKLYHMHLCVRMPCVFNPSVMTKREMQVGFGLELVSCGTSRQWSIWSTVLSQRRPASGSSGKIIPIGRINNYQKPQWTNAFFKSSKFMPLTYCEILSHIL